LKAHIKAWKAENMKNCPLKDYEREVEAKRGELEGKLKKLEEQKELEELSTYLEQIDEIEE